MEVDEALLSRAIRDQTHRPLVRIYEWDRPALSVGAHQRLSEELVARCGKLGVEVVRRPTGGSAVLHGEDLTYCVIARHGAMGVMDAYCEVAGALIDGLKELGIAAQVGVRSPGSRPSQAPWGAQGPRTACFATTLGADLQVNGEKICGSAQLRRRGWFLQHGSIPLKDNRRQTRVLLRHPGPIGSTCIERLRPGTSVQELADCLVAGFTSRWGAAREIPLEQIRPCPGLPADVL